VKFAENAARMSSWPKGMCHWGVVYLIKKHRAIERATRWNNDFNYVFVRVLRMFFIIRIFAKH
jgi:hypothetical protein